MLIANYSYINQICGHNHSGVTNPVWIISPHRMRGYYGSPQTESVSEQKIRDSFSTGTNPPYSYMMGDKGSLLSATTTISGDSDITTNLSKGINIESALSGSGDITDAQLSLITQLASSLSGSGSVTVANLVGVVSLASSLIGTGSLSAGLNVVAFMNATLEGDGNLTSDLKGTLSMSAAIYVNQSEATVQQLIEGVWNAIATSYNNTGTMGELLNNTGGGASPTLIAEAVWDELKATHTDPDSFGELLQNLETAVATIKTLTYANLK